VNALLVVMPLSEKYLSLVRSYFQQGGKRHPGLIAIESAGAIATVAQAYESYDLPKGTLRGSPPIPDDDLTTLVDRATVRAGFRGKRENQAVIITASASA